MDAKFQPSGGKFGATAAYGCFEPAAGGRIIVLRKNPLGAGKAGPPRGKVGAEEKQVASFHLAGQAAQEGEGLEVGEDTEEGEQSTRGKGEVEGGKSLGKVNFAEGFLLGGQAVGGSAGKREVGVGGQKIARFGKFLQKQGLFGSLRTPKGDQGIGEGQFFTEDPCRTLVEISDRGAFQERGAGTMNPFPKTAEGWMGIEGGSGEFDSHDSD